MFSYNKEQLYYEENLYQVGGRLGLRFYPDALVRPYAGIGIGWSEQKWFYSYLSESYSGHQLREIAFLGASVLPFAYLFKEQKIGQRLSGISLEIETSAFYSREWYDDTSTKQYLSFPWVGGSIHYNF